MINNSLSKLIFSGILTCAFSAHANIVECGGDFSSYKDRVRKDALSKGISQTAIDEVLRSASYSQKVIDSDRRQGVFKKTFTEFAHMVIRQDRINTGARKMKDYKMYFEWAEGLYGVPREVITAFWALETDFGGFQGNFNTVSSLITLSHDCRRPELFYPQLLGAMKLTEKGDINPASMTGAWAGEIGQVQMLPNDILKYGFDADGDGVVNLKGSAPDALLSAAKMLSSHGWKPFEPWVQEVSISSSNIDAPNIWENSSLDKTMSVAKWAELGVVIARDYKFQAEGDMQVSLVAPQGRKGPKFFVFDNFRVFLEWNQSFVYTLSAAHLANTLAGANWFNEGSPDPKLSDDEVKEVQKLLQARGHDVGKIDGIIGGGTRRATQVTQKEFGMVTDGWPTRELLNKLRN